MLGIIILLVLISINFIYLFIRYKQKLTQAIHYINDINLHINFVYEKMKIIDNKGLFENDEELGVMFNQMKQLITILNNLANSGENNE